MFKLKFKNYPIPLKFQFKKLITTYYSNVNCANFKSKTFNIWFLNGKYHLSIRLYNWSIWNKKQKKII